MSWGGLFEEASLVPGWVAGDSEVTQELLEMVEEEMIEETEAVRVMGESDCVCGELVKDTGIDAGCSVGGREEVEVLVIVVVAVASEDRKPVDLDTMPCKLKGASSIEKGNPKAVEGDDGA